MKGDGGFDERDATALRAAYRTLQSERSASCPSAETLAALVIGDLEGDARSRCGDHVASCRPCAEDYRDLLEVHALASKRLSARPALRTLAIAAAAVLLAAAGALILQRSERPVDALRGKPPAAAVEPADGRTLAEPPSTLRWPAQPEAEGCRVRLFASSGDTLWDADARNLDRIELPQAVRTRIQAGGSYYWTVEVRLPLGRQRLGPYSFTIGR